MQNFPKIVRKSIIIYSKYFNYYYSILSDKTSNIRHLFKIIISDEIFL